MSGVEHNQNNQRKHFRIKFTAPIEISIRVEKVKGKIVDKKTFAPILLLDISAGGLRFVSNINLPVGEIFIYSVQIQLLSKEFQVQGKIIRTKEIAEGLFEYGYEFMFEVPEESSRLFQFTNMIAVHLRKNKSLEFVSHEVVRELWVRYTSLL